MRRWWAGSLLLCGLVACGNGGSGGGNKPVPAAPASNPQNAPAAPTQAEAARPRVSISGQITYARVPFAAGAWQGLDHGATYTTPVRGATVQLVSASDAVLAEGEVDATGGYQLDAPAGTPVKVRVLAELKSRRGGGFHISVRDNTRSDALYVLEGSLADSGTDADQSRDLHAATGYAAGAYSEPRSAAPFAVLDSLYDALTLVREADPAVVLPPLEVFWSERNAPVGGALHEGHIGTSFYSPGDTAIYLLGAEHSDTDEFDRGVIQHEFAHYLENTLSRSESLGGRHHMYSLLDMRVALGEALGNAFAGLAGGDPQYRDSMGNGQTRGFVIDVERRPSARHGWFSEASIQSVLYDLADSEQDEGDHLALGFGALYRALTDSAYLEFEGFASIFSLAASLTRQNAEAAPAIRELLADYQISGRDGWAEGESNDGGMGHTLPVFPNWRAGGGGVLCSRASSQGYNGLGGRSFARLEISRAGRYGFHVSRDSGPPGGDPELRVTRRGEQVLAGRGNSRKSITGHLAPGNYVVELFDSALLDSGEPGQLACYRISVNY